MLNRYQKNGRGARVRPRTGGRGVLAIALAVAALAACNTDRLLDVNAPSRVPAEIFDRPDQAQLMVTSAVADFECAIGSFVLIEGIVSDELTDAQLGAAGWDYDRRSSQPNGLYGTGSCTNNQLPGIYTPLSTARWSAETALKKLQGWTDAQVPNRQLLIATAALYTGFSYAMMGMSMCSAAFDLGKPIDQKAMFAEAEKRFDIAIEAATAAGADAEDLLNAAYVGRARVRLFQGNLTGAAADAAKVPAGFVFEATAASDDNRRYNRIFAATTKYGYYSVESLSRALTTEGKADPRAAVVKTATRAFDAVTPIYAATKYSSESSPIRIASYEEAQLILAEAQGGTQAVTIINALRAAYSLPAYTGPTDAASIKTLIANERQRTLFVEGFRAYDIQRFSLPLNPAVGTTYPNKGGEYGSVVCFPLPDVERFNNPNATGS